MDFTEDPDHALGLPRALADGATAPLIVFSLSLIPYVFATVMSMWLEALSKPTPAMLLMWGANVVNLAIDLGRGEQLGLRIGAEHRNIKP